MSRHITAAKNSDDFSWIGTCECLYPLHASDRTDFLAALWWMALLCATLLLFYVNLLLPD